MPNYQFEGVIGFALIVEMTLKSLVLAMKMFFPCSMFKESVESFEKCLKESAFFSKLFHYFQSKIMENLDIFKLFKFNYESFAIFE
jgi:hypothetical protein